MKFRRLKKFLLYLPAAAAVIVLIVAWVDRNYIFNLSHSLPGSIYVKEPGNLPERGSTVAACPPEHAIQAGLIMGSIKKDPFYRHAPCPLHSRPVIKILAAVPGDYVSAGGSQEILINGRPFPGSAPLHSSILPRWRFTGHLGEDEYLLLSPAADGYDSRYWGPVRRKDVIVQLRKVF